VLQLLQQLLERGLVEIRRKNREMGDVERGRIVVLRRI
jgi:hypothetical protein